MTTSTPRRPKSRPARPTSPSAAAPNALTVAQLRELAREAEVSGYSRMRKDELERELAARGRLPAPATPAVAPASPPAPPARPTGSATAAPRPPAIAAAAGLPDTATPALNEDIERLPRAREPQLGLLPQRPGVVQAYWVLPQELTRSLPPLQLRLMRTGAGDEQLIAELPVAAGSGHHYFELTDDLDPGILYLQLGYYDSGRQFVNAIGRSLAHMPSLYASHHDGRVAQLSEAQFRALYLHSGGSEHDGRLGWSNSSTSSPAAPFSAPSSPPFNR